jgi:hypothetical protein
MPSLLRSANPIITYAGKNVTTDWVPALLHLCWKRGIGMEAKADTITISLADPTGHFRYTYNLKCKEKLRLQVESWNWNHIGEHVLSDATEMTITRVEIEQSKDRGSVVNLTASSIPPMAHFRTTKKSRAVEQTDLETLAAAIAKDNGWKLNYTASVNPQVAHAECHDQSDATFLQRFCHEHDLTFLPKDGVLYIQSIADLEKQAPKGTILCPTPQNAGGINGRGIISWRLEEDVEDTYANAVLSTKDVKTGKITTGIAQDPDQNGPTHNVVHRPVGPVVDREEGAVIEPSQ